MAETKTDPLDFHTLTERLEADPTAFRADQVRAIVADELTRQADVIAERIRMHGLGRHGWCTRCEAWERDEATLRARAAELRKDTAAAPKYPKFEAFKARQLRTREPIKSLVAQRKALGLTQAQVAERMDVTQSTVAEFEAGTADARMSTLRRYALAVGAVVRHQVTPVEAEEAVDAE